MLNKMYVKNIKIFLKKKKAKSVNMLMSHTEISLKKNKKRSAIMIVRDIKSF